MLSIEDRSLCELLGELSKIDYQFVTPTPETHRRVIARRDLAQDIRDIFGWSLPFAPETAGPRLVGLLDASGMMLAEGSRMRSAVRVSSIGDSLFLHSAYPTTQVNSVFFGPDSYRFVNFVRGELLDARPVGRVVDIGTGSGVGGIITAMEARPTSVTLSDINPLALRLARINAQHNRVEVEAVQGPGLEAIETSIDLAVSNPPFLMDAAGRSYRDGGGLYGAARSLEWALATADKLELGGRLLLYTASAIVGGHDGLKTALLERLDSLRFTVSYRELDPDVFGEQLEELQYEDVERIAAVGIVIQRLEE